MCVFLVLQFFGLFSMNRFHFGTETRIDSFDESKLESSRNEPSQVGLSHQQPTIKKNRALSNLSALITSCFDIQECTSIKIKENRARLFNRI